MSSDPVDDDALATKDAVEPVPILNKPSQKKRPADPSASAAPRVTWNEENLAEHDKERGTRQKIDEPPTPFVRSPPSISEDEDAQNVSPSKPSKTSRTLDAAALQSRLEELSAATAAAETEAGSAEGYRDPDSPARSVRSVVWTDGGGPTKKSSEAFKAKRKAHYNEFLVMRSALQPKPSKAADGKSSDESDGD
eukprot:TRINITY_DN30508_c0_g1_i1.p1 TRINITY_DN30508_c0_g1~~TRINITY_DN30508_c0_g1_i1.p1  ORF type:complete len:203 (-),score=51.87 TRINITY_DN30508_c0_g1_i1:170-751(-)